MTTLIAAALAVAASTGLAQPSQAPTSTPAVVTAAPGAVTTVKDPAVGERIMALVRAGKCGPARKAAQQAGDEPLADQIASMCGAKPSDPFARRGGAGGGGGGGRKGGGGR